MQLILFSRSVIALRAPRCALPPKCKADPPILIGPTHLWLLCGLVVIPVLACSKDEDAGRMDAGQESTADASVDADEDGIGREADPVVLTGNASRS